MNEWMVLRNASAGIIPHYGTRDVFGGLTFLKAGGDRDLNSVSPLTDQNETWYVEADCDADDEQEEPRDLGEKCERIALEKEVRQMKRLVDPLLPSKKDVDEHWIRGTCSLQELV